VLLRMGRVDEAVVRLERAATSWSEGPTSPFADNSALVKALVMSGQFRKARAVATEAIRRTQPWVRSHSDAASGMAAVLMADGEFEQANQVLSAALRHEAALGSLEALLSAEQVDALYLAGGAPDSLKKAGQRIVRGKHDARYRAEIAVGIAISEHAAGSCNGECRSAGRELELESERGARLIYLVGKMKLGLLAFDHRRKRDTEQAWRAVQGCMDLGIAPGLKWWLRRYAERAPTALAVSGGSEVVCRLGALDPDGWRDALIETLQQASGRDREQLVESLSRMANKSTIEALGKIGGQDIADLRRRLKTVQASRLYLRTFGRMSLHRGDWNGSQVPVKKKRVRTLLALLAARAHTDLSRDQCVEILWPAADADAGINNLNQTVFQLRRYIDPEYRGGESPEYVISTSEQVAVNPSLVHTDLSELRRLPQRMQGADWSQRQHAARRAISLIRGEFLGDLIYEDWSATYQNRVHSEVRELLLPIATASPIEFSVEVSLLAASALLMLDPWDERAVVAMADGLGRSGRRVAARSLLTDFATRYERELEVEPSEEVARALTAVGPR
jgi:DNA-binding SARP family transcriptional activator